VQAQKQSCGYPPSQPWRCILGIRSQKRMARYSNAISPFLPLSLQASLPLPTNITSFLLPSARSAFRNCNDPFAIDGSNATPEETLPQKRSRRQRKPNRVGRKRKRKGAVMVVACECPRHWPRSPHARSKPRPRRKNNRARTGSSAAISLSWKQRNWL
jgi:hypothetical protein